MAFTLPAAAALMAAPFFIVDGLFVRGAYHVGDAINTADVLFNFAWGVPAFVIAKILAPAFFARQDTKRPAQFAMYSVIFNVVLGVAGFMALKAMGQHGARALAAATSGASWINVAMMWFALKKSDWYRPSARFWFRIGRIGLACLALAAVLVGFELIRTPLQDALFHSKEIALGVAVIVAVAVYAVAALALGAVSMSEIKGLLSRPPRTPAQAVAAAPPEPPPAGDA
jgi:putative peptidoglycan lipid II flippase